MQESASKEALRGCTIALDLLLDFGLILDVSSSCSPKVVYLNGVLAERIGCDGCKAPGVNEVRIIQ